jgi:hypothetical protein
VISTYCGGLKRTHSEKMRSMRCGILIDAHLAVVVDLSLALGKL